MQIPPGYSPFLFDFLSKRKKTKNQKRRHKIQKSVRVSLYKKECCRTENMAMIGKKVFFREVTGKGVSDYVKYPCRCLSKNS